MDPVFYLGINSLWDELRLLPAGGLWWVNIDRYEDAIKLVNRTVAAQNERAKVAVITTGEMQHQHIKLEGDHGPKRLFLFALPHDSKAFDGLTQDLLCSLHPHHCMVIILCDENSLHNISAAHLRRWVKAANAWAKYHHCTLLLLNSSADPDRYISALANQYALLSGLTTLRYEGDTWLYDVAFWFNQKGVSARQQLRLVETGQHWTLPPQQEIAPQSRNDERRVLSHLSVLEGAPPLSENWSLFDSNDALFTEARQAQAATVIFALTSNSQVESVARQIHALRRQRGSAMKIIVRESQGSVRATDERLLLGCGANIVIPWNAPLSRCLTLIESVQGQTFSRQVPQDIAILLDSMQPLKLRGYQPWETFCDSVAALMNNTLLPKDGKGILVALRPVPGIRVEQALTLCRPPRAGDIVTLGENRLVLFLSFCRIPDLDTALKHIFPLPVADIFSNRMVWYEDAQIAAEIVQMRAMQPEKWSKPLKMTADAAPAVSLHHDDNARRRVPTPIILLSEPEGEPRL